MPQSSTLYIRYNKPKTYGSVALLIGVLVLLGWIFRIRELVHLYTGSGTVTINTAICLSVAGFALILPAMVRDSWLSRTRMICGAIIALIAGMTIFEIVNDLTLAIDLNAWQREFSPNTRYPGQMAPNTAVGFVLLGFSLVAIEYGAKPTVAAVVRLLTGATILIGIIGIIGHFAGLEFLYSWRGVGRMALPTACGLTLLGLGTWLALNKLDTQAASADSAALRSVRGISTLMLIFIATVTGLTGFALSQKRAEQIMADEMVRQTSDRRLLFQTVLTYRTERAALISTRPALISWMRHMLQHPQDNTVRAQLQMSVNSYLGHGFSAIAYETDRTRWAFAGNFITNPAIAVPIHTNGSSQLLWNDGYVLRTRIPMQDEKGVVGFVLAEQRLDVLTQLHDEVLRWGQTGDMVVCGLEKENQICFPFRWRPKGAVVPGHLDGQPLPLTRAVNGEISVITALDFRRERVIAAFGPIGTSGLGLAMKKDTWELYAPIRAQFLWALPSIGLLVLLGTWFTRRQLRPLIRTLSDSREQLARLAHHDALTGLSNRSLFQENIGQAMARTKRSKKFMALFYLDIDNFKRINDAHGHLVGDQVLCWFADQLRKSRRATDSVARLGGDEFTIILESLNSPRDAERLAQNIVNAMNNAKPDIPQNIKVSTSIGVALYGGQEMTPEQLIDSADQALYRAKQKGRNCFEIDMSEYKRP